MKKRDGKNSCEHLVCSPGVWLVFKYPLLREACIPWKQNKTKQKINSEFTLFAAFTHDVTQICRPERSLKKQSKREKLLQETSGFFLSGRTWAQSSKELCRTSLGRSCHINFGDFFSSSKSPLPHSPSILLKAVVRSQAWRPLLFRKWLLWFILPANLLTRAKTLYPFPAHRNPLVPRKAAPCCQSSQGYRVLNANQEKADWIQEQNWFLAHRLVTRAQQRSNMSQQ